MYVNHVPYIIWGQNIVCFLFMSLIAFISLIHKSVKPKEHLRSYLLPALIFLLALTLINPGMDGVHRWISIGIIRLNVAMIVLPAILIEVGWILQIKGFKTGLFISIGISCFLLFQPDASQLTGFAISAMVLLSARTRSKKLRIIIIIIFILPIVFSWLNLDHLPPVSYVEGIVSMVAQMGLVWLICGIISLAILPMHFLVFPPQNAKLVSRCIGLYFIVMIGSTWFGNFPVPIMGYGMSPIIGYSIAAIWYQAHYRYQPIMK